MRAACCSAVADGLGAAGDRASAAAIEVLKSLETLQPDPAPSPVATPRRWSRPLPQDGPSPVTGRWPPGTC